MEQYSNIFADKFPEVAKEWHPSKNGDLTPYDVTFGSHQRVWWRCAKGHEWIAQVSSRSRGLNCPVCSNRKVQVGVNDLGTTHPEIAVQWHKTRNGALTPQDVVFGHYQKVWWQCGMGHEWQATILSRTYMGNSCPICAGKIVIPGDNDLASQKPHIAAQWNAEKNGTLTPQDVTTYSNRRVWWRCEEGHEYAAAISQRTGDGRSCPYCAGRTVLAGFNDLATKSPEIAAQWHETLNGALTPQMVTAGSRKKVWWQCKAGHVWKAVVYSRTGSKSGCPVCAGRVKESKQLLYEDIMAQEKNTVK